MAESRTPLNIYEDGKEAVGSERHIEKNEANREEETVAKSIITKFKRLSLGRNKSRKTNDVNDRKVDGRMPQIPKRCCGRGCSR